MKLKKFEVLREGRKQGIIKALSLVESLIANSDTKVIKEMARGSRYDDETQGYFDAQSDYDKKYWKKALWKVINIQGHKFIIKKPYSLQTTFWYGYSDFGQGQSYDSAQKQVGKEDLKKFIDANAGDIKETIELLEGKKARGTRFEYSGSKPAIIFLLSKLDYSKSNEVFMKFIPSLYLTDKSTPEQRRANIIEWLGETNAWDIIYPTKEEKQKVLDAYKALYEDTVKRCQAYWKRFGNTKIKSDTFWLDR